MWRVASSPAILSAWRQGLRSAPRARVAGPRWAWQRRAGESLRRSRSSRDRRNGAGSDNADVRRLRALLARNDIELDPLVVIEAAEAVRCDGGVVREQVRASTIR